MPYTSDELETIGWAFHRGQVAGCPRCNARVKAEVAAYVGKASVDVEFWCPRCGESGRFQPKDVGGEWTPDERSRIVEVFRRNETALCPDDSARLSVIP